MVPLAIGPVLVVGWSAFLRTLNTQGIVVGDHRTNKIIRAGLSLCRKWFCIWELLAMIRVVAYGIFLGPAPNISPQKILVWSPVFTICPGYFILQSFSPCFPPQCPWISTPSLPPPPHTTQHWNPLVRVVPHNVKTGTRLQPLSYCCFFALRKSGIQVSGYENWDLGVFIKANNKLRLSCAKLSTAWASYPLAKSSN